MTREQFFRAGVGAMVVNPEGLVLALERSDVPGAWQMPQGGLELGEEPVDAVFRELEEEAGLMVADLELIAAYPTPLAYELPSYARSQKTGRGQAIYWFLLELTGDPGRTDLTVGGESRAWRWIRFDDLIDQVVDFRRPVYRALAEHFDEQLQRTGIVHRLRG